MGTSHEYESKTTKGKFKSLKRTIGLTMLASALIPVFLAAIIIGALLKPSLDGLGKAIHGTRTQMAGGVVGKNLQAGATNIMIEIDTFMRERISDVISWSQVPLIVHSARKGAESATQRGLMQLDAKVIESRMNADRALFPGSEVAEFLVYIRERSSVFKEIFFTDKHGFNVAFSNKTSDFIQSDESWWQVAWAQGIFIGDIEHDVSAGV